MESNAPRQGSTGTSDQKTRWEGPPESRPAGYLPAKDDPETNPDANGEIVAYPDRSDDRDAVNTGKDKI